MREEGADDLVLVQLLLLEGEEEERQWRWRQSEGEEEEEETLWQQQAALGASVVVMRVSRVASVVVRLVLVTSRTTVMTTEQASLLVK